MLPQPAQWVNPRDGHVWVFVATRDGLAGLTVGVTQGGTPGIQPVWTVKGGAVTSPLVAGDVLYTAGSGHIEARDPATGRVVWSDKGIGRIHWASPVVVDGVLYIADESGSLLAYALAP